MYIIYHTNRSVVFLRIFWLKFLSFLAVVLVWAPSPYRGPHPQRPAMLRRQWGLRPILSNRREYTPPRCSGGPPLQVSDFQTTAIPAQGTYNKFVLYAFSVFKIFIINICFATEIIALPLEFIYLFARLTVVGFPDNYLVFERTPGFFLPPPSLTVSLFAWVLFPHHQVVFIIVDDKFPIRQKEYEW